MYYLVLDSKSNANELINPPESGTNGSTFFRRFFYLHQLYLNIYTINDKKQMLLKYETRALPIVGNGL